MLVVENLCKKYPTFSLDNVSFKLEGGYILGFIGANGAGKTTTLKSILNIVKPDSGKVEILGKDFAKNEIDIKQEIGFMLEPFDFYSKTKIKKIANVYKSFYNEWDELKYQNYLKRFHLDENKQVCQLSAGMKVKLGISLALSHNAKLIIFDEPTSGLDPVARDELLDLFQEIVENGNKSILFSTHITSDLDKCADFIIFISNGKLIANNTKDQLIADHKLIQGKNSALTSSLESRIIAKKVTHFGFTALIKTKDLIDSDDVEIETPNLEDLMIYYNKEENND